MAHLLFSHVFHWQALKECCFDQIVKYSFKESKTNLFPSAHWEYLCASDREKKSRKKYGSRHDIMLQ